jgi:hypothetical protein
MANDAHSLPVTPVKAGAQGFSAASLGALGPGFRRDDGEWND